MPTPPSEEPKNELQPREQHCVCRGLIIGANQRAAWFSCAIAKNNVWWHSRLDRERGTTLTKKRRASHLALDRNPGRHRLRAPIYSPTNIGRIAAAAVTAVGAAGTTMAVTASPASAACDGGDRAHSVQTSSAAPTPLQGNGMATNVSSTQERWCDLRTAEWGVVLPWLVAIPCDYQGQIVVYNPDGSSANKSNTSSFHSGCSYDGWFYHDPLDGVYAEDKRFTTKWKSNNTNNNWYTIGTLKD